MGMGLSTVYQRVARCLFWLSRRDRDFASFSLVPRDEIKIFSQNLRVRDEIEIFVHWISGFETRSRFSVIWSRNSRQDRDFSTTFFLPCDIQNCIFLYTTNTYSWIRKSQSNPRRDFLTPSWAIVEWGQSCNTSKSTFTFVQIVSRHWQCHCARMRTVSPEVGWKWK